MMRIAFGDFSTTCPTTVSMIFLLISRRSSRLIPGFRGTPDVTITTSESFVSSYPLEPTTFESKPSTGLAWRRSSAFPWGIPSRISTKTTSPSSFSAAQWAAVAPTKPAPIIEIFFLPIKSLLLRGKIEYRNPKQFQDLNFKVPHHLYPLPSGERVGVRGFWRIQFDNPSNKNHRSSE